MATRAGDLNARIIIEKRIETTNEALEVVDEWVNLFGDGVSVAAKWRGARRTADSVINDRVSAPEEALVSVRYMRGINASCRVRLIGDDSDTPWMISATPMKSVNGAFLEFTVVREVMAL